MKYYFSKMKGGEKNPPRIALSEIAWTWFGIFVSLLCLFLIAPHFKTFTSGYPLLFASIGASSVLVFGLPDSPFSQPRSVIGGHVVSAFSGVTFFYFFESTPVLAASFAVSFAGALMFLTKTIHPPGGATALLVILFEEFQSLGYWFLLTPCAISSIMICFFGLIINNMSPMRKYPRFWW